MEFIERATIKKISIKLKRMIVKIPQSTVPTQTFLFLILIFAQSIAAQDTIYTKSDSSLILANILEVNPDNLKYKKHSNIDGPLYTIEKNKISKVVFENGDVETYSQEDPSVKKVNRQPNTKLVSGSRLFITYKDIDDKRNVDASDAISMLKSALEDKTSCLVVNTIDEADFAVELNVIKKIMAERSAKILITHILSNKTIFESKWIRGTSNAFSGYSGTRDAIKKIVAKHLVEEYPKIKF